MIEATIAMLKARRDERVAAAGVISALFCDDPMEAVARLENCRDTARLCATEATTSPRRRIFRRVASYAEDMIGPVRQIAERRLVQDESEGR